ncbi:MAG TPA: hypothetical protein VFS40_07805 [Gemmatimonadales bacterium]|nr:hypothetical protein [Gemmatimonadales bacterium]
MQPRSIAGSIAGSLVVGLTLLATPLVAQSGDRYSTYDRPVPHADPDGYATPPGRRVAPRPLPRVAPRVVTVERAAPRGWARPVWVQRGYRPVTIWYVDGRYYDRYDPFWERGVRRVVVREVVVYERDGRYYRDWDRDGDWDRRDDWLRKHDDWVRKHYDDRNFDRKHREWHAKHGWRGARDRD